MHTTNDLDTIHSTDLDGVTGGGSDRDVAQLVDDNAKTTADRFKLVQSGQLDQEDFRFFLDNQRRDANLLAHRGAR